MPLHTELTISHVIQKRISKPLEPSSAHARHTWRLESSNQWSPFQNSHSAQTSSHQSNPRRQKEKKGEKDTAFEKRKNLFTTFLHAPALSGWTVNSEVNKTKKTWPRKACAQCQPYSCGDWDVLHISPEWYNPKKSTSPNQSHRQWSLKSTYPTNGAFIGDQNLLTLGNVQLGQALNDGIFIRAWKKPMKTIKLLVPEPEGCSGLAQDVPLATQPYTHACTTWVSFVHECLSPAAPHHRTEKARARYFYVFRYFYGQDLDFQWDPSHPTPSSALTRQWGDANGWTSPPEKHQ